MRRHLFFSLGMFVVENGWKQILAGLMILSINTFLTCPLSKRRCSSFLYPFEQYLIFCQIYEAKVKWLKVIFPIFLTKFNLILFGHEMGKGRKGQYIVFSMEQDFVRFISNIWFSQWNKILSGFVWCRYIINFTKFYNVNGLSLIIFLECGQIPINIGSHRIRSYIQRKQDTNR